MYRLKRFLLSFILILIFCSNSFSQSAWNKVTSPTTKDLKNCFFTDVNNGWISGDSGIILHTTDGGSNWYIQNTGIEHDIKSLFFINDSNGWATAWRYTSDSVSFPGTIILKTSDGGNKWNHTIYPDTNTYLNSIYFLDSLKGFMGATPNFILNTTDGGKNWNRSNSDTTIYDNLPILKIEFYNDQFGYASGGTRDFAGIVWTTTDSGLNWKTHLISLDQITDFWIVNQDSVICTGGDFKFGSNYFTSSDFAKSWITYGLGYFGIATAIEFRTVYEAWITLGNSRRFYFSKDGGLTWLPKDTPSQSSIFDIVFPDSLTGFAVGNNGVILKYNSSPLNVNNLSQNSDPDAFYLFQNYPNPFNPVTKISFELPSNSDLGNLFDVTLKIYDILGNEIETLLNEKLNAGIYETEFNGNNYPSGIYFYKLEAGFPNSSASGKFSQTRRMVLIK